jgi:hypothetical protein
VPLHDLVVKHQRFSFTDWALGGEGLEALDALQQRLAPEDLVDRVRWLFDEHLPDLPEMNEEEFNHEKFEAAVSRRRAEALTQLWSGRNGRSDLLRLVRESKVPGLVGVAVANAKLSDAGDFLLDQIDSEERPIVVAASAWAYQQTRAAGWAWTQSQAGALEGRPLAVARVLVQSDELEQAWSAAAKDPDVESAYWAEFSPYGRGQEFALAENAARQLLSHDRPRAAVTLMNLYAGSVGMDPELALQGLERLITLPADHPDQFRVDGHDIERLLDHVRSSEVDEDRLGLLEWRLRPALRFGAHSPVLERKLAREPAFFVDVLSIVFKPRHRDPEREVPSHLATNAYRLLDDWRILPGSEAAGSAIDEVKLNAWIDELLPRLREADRLEIGLDQIGKILAKGPADHDGLWPSRPVRAAIERLASSELDVGFRVEVYNSRGVTSRGLTAGGDQERQLRDRYAALATGVRDEWPRTASILRSLSDGYAAEARRHDEDVERFREGLDR